MPLLAMAAVSVLSVACTSVEKTPRALREMMQRADMPETAGYNDDERFRQLLAEHPELVNKIDDYRGWRYETVLQAAAMTGQVEKVKALLAAGADTVLPLERTNVEDQPVYGAFIRGHTTEDVTLLRMLLLAGGCRGIEAPLRAKVQKVWAESPFRGRAEEMIMQYTKP